MELQLNERELNVTELISTAWQIFKKNFTVLLPAILLVVLLNITHTTLSHIFIHSMKEGNFLPSHLLNASYSILLNFINISFILIIDNAIDGEVISFKETINKTVGFWPSSLWANFLAIIIIGCLFLLIIVPGIIWSVYYFFVTIAVVLKGKKGKEALNFSKSIVKKRWWKVFLIIFVIAVLAIAPAIFINVVYGVTQKKMHFLFSLESMPLGLKLFSSLISSLVVGFFITAKVVFFRNIEYLNDISETVESPLNPIEKIKGPLDFIPTFGRDNVAPPRYVDHAGE